MLYGATPFAQPLETAACLRPVMTLESRVIAVRELPAGEPLGYGGTFVTTRATRIGVVAMGYADGYPRHAPSGAPVAVDGQLTQLIGRVSMDMLMVDLTELPQAGLGSRVELWGNQVAISELASLCGTIAYQLLCNLKRVPRLYHSD
jgi:alanine racemase